MRQNPLTDIYCNDPNKVVETLKQFNNLAKIIVSNPTKMIPLDGSRKEAYWMESLGNPNKSITQYDGKPQTLINMELTKFYKDFTEVKP